MQVVLVLTLVGARMRVPARAALITSCSSIVEPLCEGCAFRCDGCPWAWMDDGVEAHLLLARDRCSRAELGLWEADYASLVAETYGEVASQLQGNETSQRGTEDAEW